MPWKGKPFGWGVPKPYLGYLPEPMDASINGLRQLTDDLSARDVEPGASLKITLNYIEPPSVRLAIDLQLRAMNAPLRLKLKAGRVPKPDPRKPAGRVKFLLWKYWFKTARPGLPPPRDKRVVEAIAELARQPYDYQANWHAAAAAAKPFDANTLPDVLAVMVHPPPITDGTPAWIWLPRVQLAAAQVVAHLDRGWSVSDRWEALQELLRNPIDWTTEAAIIALAQLARQMPEISADVRRVYFELLQRVPRQGHCCYFSGLCHNWLLLPDVPDDERAQVNAMLTDSQAA